MQRVTNRNSSRRMRLARDFHYALMGEIFCLLDNLAAFDAPPEVLQHDPEFERVQELARAECKQQIEWDGQLPEGLSEADADQIVVDLADKLASAIINSGMPLASLPEDLIADEIKSSLMAQALVYRGANSIGELCHRLAAPYPH
jgi:hypothetical protein